MSLEDTLSSWAQGPGTTEQQKCDNAETAVKKAIARDSTLSVRSVTCFAQGSYRQRTNVRADSDVDISAYCTDTIFFDLPDGTTAADFGISTPAQYSHPAYKRDVQSALCSYFGSAAVTSGNKAFDIHENTYRVDCDVVPTFEYRRYWEDGSYRQGTAFLCDDGSRIINFPQQTYDNGVTKNTNTGRRFKRAVRILKRLSNRMSEDGIAEAKAVPSFLLECLAWNVPNEGFSHSTYTADIRYVLAHVFNETRSDQDCNEWCEVNNCKYLFRPTQPWTRQQANAFAGRAWRYLGFE